MNSDYWCKQCVADDVSRQAHNRLVSRIDAHVMSTPQRRATVAEIAKALGDVTEDNIIKTLEEEFCIPSAGSNGHEHLTFSHSAEYRLLATNGRNRLR
jgi:hypothetical protein